MVQMSNDTAVVKQLPLQAQHWIQDRRNHYWLDHGVGYHDKISQLEEGCELIEDWQDEHNPACNKIHEIDMTEFFHKDTADAKTTERQVMRYIAKGGFRTAWMVSEYDDTKRVLKTLRYDESTFEQHRIDAVAMEQLTASPYVADVYGYCAFSTLVEYSTEADLSHIFDREIPPTKEELFKIALDTARAVADVHHFNSDGRATMVHMDIKPTQWIQLDGMYKLNDFNLAKFTSWNPERKQYCGTALGYQEGRWQAPEQYLRSAPLTHRADVFSLGNVLYFLLTGNEPFHEMSEENGGKEVQKETHLNIDGSILNSRHPFDVSLQKAIDMCRVYDPTNVPMHKA